MSERFPPMFAVRNRGEEPSLDQRGVWLIACTEDGIGYIQFHSFNEKFFGEMICLEGFEMHQNHSMDENGYIKPAIQLTAVTKTGTVFTGDVIP